jgi:hypothetical protein
MELAREFFVLEHQGRGGDASRSSYMAAAQASIEAAAQHSSMEEPGAEEPV